MSGNARRVKPFDIFDCATCIANEMMMPVDVGVETRGFGVNGDFSHKARGLKRMQIVVNGSAGCAGIARIHGSVDFLSGSVHRVPHQMFHDEESLGGAAKSVGAQGQLNFFLQFIQNLL
jgi:hypothetical protein